MKIGSKSICVCVCVCIHATPFLISIMDPKPSIKWILKSPYVAHSMHFQKSVVTTATEAIKHIRAVWKDLFGHDNLRTCYVIPYLMLQERVINNSEAKLVHLNGCFHHFATARNSNLKQSFTDRSTNKQVTSAQIIDFAAEAVAFLRNQEGNILDGLSRIDIFYNESVKQLVVNEVESLDAVYFTTNHNVQCTTDQWLTKFWECKITRV